MGWDQPWPPKLPQTRPSMLTRWLPHSLNWCQIVFICTESPTESHKNLIILVKIIKLHKREHVNLWHRPLGDVQLVVEVPRHWGGATEAEQNTWRNVEHKVDLRKCTFWLKGRYWPRRRSLVASGALWSGIAVQNNPIRNLSHIHKDNGEQNCLLLGAILLNMSIKKFHVGKIAFCAEHFSCTKHAQIFLWRKIAPHENICSTDNVRSVRDKYHVWPRSPIFDLHLINSQSFEDA